MIEAPPVNPGAFQVMLIVVDDFCEESSTKSVGDPGFVIIIAPFPFGDTIESP